HERRDLNGLGAGRRYPQDFALPLRQWVLTALPGGNGQLRIDDPPPGDHAADRLGEFLRRRVLEQVSGNVRGERATQVSLPPETGQDERGATRQLLAQLRRRRQPVDAGQRDVDDRDVRLVFACVADDIVATLDFGDHLHVWFEFDEGDQRAAHHRNILGEQNLQRQHASLPKRRRSFCTAANSE